MPIPPAHPHRLPGTPQRLEAAVRTLHGDIGADFELVAHAPAAVSEHLHREAQLRLPGSGRNGEGMRLPEAVGIDCDERELAGVEREHLPLRMQHQLGGALQLVDRLEGKRMLPPLRRVPKLPAGECGETREHTSNGVIRGKHIVTDVRARRPGTARS